MAGSPSVKKRGLRTVAVSLLLGAMALPACGGNSGTTSTGTNGSNNGTTGTNNGTVGSNNGTVGSNNGQNNGVEPGISVSKTAVQTTESGGTDTFTVVLESEPTQNVTVSVASSNEDEGTVSPASLSFTPDNWDVPKTVTVTGVDDNAADGNQDFTLTLTASSDDDAYDGFSIPSVTATNIDDDMATLRVSATSATVSEDGTSATFDITIGAAPSDDVTITLAPSDDTQFATDVATVTFDAGAANVTKSVTITAIDDDLVEGLHNLTLALSAASGDPAYDVIDPTDINVSIVDNDSASIAVTPAALTLSESGNTTGTFTITLGTAPSDAVTIDVSSSDTSEATVSPAQVTLDATTLSATVTVTTVDDADVDGAQLVSILTGDATSNDAAYDGTTVADVPVTVLDNDAAAINVTPSSLTVAENAGQGTFDVSLSAAPQSDVIVDVASSNPQDLSLSATSLTFSPSNWMTTQTVTVTGTDDGLAEGTEVATLNTTVATQDTAYRNINPENVVVTITDDDVASVVVSPTVLAVSETGTTGTFTIALGSAPTADVDVSIVSSDTTEATVDRPTLTFTAQNYASPQTVTVSGEDDSEADGTTNITIQTTITSNDATYAAINPADVAVSVTDNDTASVAVAPQALTLLEGEQGVSAISLSSAPSGTVTINLTSTDSANVTVSPASVTFNGSDFATPKNITFTAVDDLLADGPQVVAITTTATSTDPDYNGINVADISVRANDNDQADFSVTPTAGLTTSEAGATTTFTVALTAAPAASVTLPVSVSDTTEGQITSTTPLVFNASNWQTGLQVTVAGVDDGDKDGAVTYQVQFAAATSGDAAYAGRSPNNVSITNFDNEAGFTVRTSTGSNLLVSESGTTDTFTAVLNSQPQQNVQLVLLPDGDEGDEYSVTPQQFVFTPANWSTPQTATVMGLVDQEIDGTQGWSIDVEVGSTIDTLYAALTDTATVDGQTTDNDAPGVTVRPTSIAMVEDNNAFFDIVLNQPANNTYSIALTSSDPDVTVSPSTVTFNPGQTTQTVTLDALDDSVVESQKTVTITTAPIVSSNTADGYHNINPDDLTITLDDDEQADLLVTIENLFFSKLLTLEDGRQTIWDLLNLRLASAPTASVIVTATSSNPAEALLSVNGGTPGATVSLVFQPGDFASNQTLRAIGVNDDLEDGSQPFEVSFSVSSSDPFYDGILEPSVPGDNIDDDKQGYTVSLDAVPMRVDENGASKTYVVWMNTAPNSDVTVTLESSDTSEASLTSGSTITYFASWGGYPWGYIMTVRGENDDLVDGAQTFQIRPTSVTTTDPFYVVEPYPTVSGINDDNDTAGLDVVSFNDEQDEDETETFRVRLFTQPTQDVTVTVASSDTTEATVSPATLTFTPGNWSSTQTVTVTTPDDNIIDGNQDILITISSTSSDSDYNNLSDVRDLRVYDIHSPGISYNGGRLLTSESGRTDTIGVVLDTQPTANVTIPVYSFDNTEVTIDKTQLVFTPQNWNVEQVVTLTGEDDLVVDGDQRALIVFDISTSPDPNYDGFDFREFYAINLDDDAAGVSVLKPAAPTYLVTDEDAGTDTFQVVLATAPAAGTIVKIDFSTHVWPTGGNGTGRATVTPSVTFDSTDWNIPQTVTVTGENNLSTVPVLGYYVQGTIDTAAMNADPVYDNSLFIEQVLGVNVDNDEEAIVLLGDMFGVTGPTSATTNMVDMQQGVFTGENGASGTFYIRGTDLPTANVPVALSVNNGEATVQANFTLTQANYRSLNAVTVTGLNPDNSAEPFGYTGFSLIANPDNASGDANYGALSDVALNGYNLDNDQCRMVAFPRTQSNDRLLGRNGVVTPYLLFLGADPLQTVSVALSESGDGFSPTGSLTLSSGAAHQSIDTYPSTLSAFNANYALVAEVTAAGACYSPASDVTTHALVVQPGGPPPGP